MPFFFVTSQTPGAEYVAVLITLCSNRSLVLRLVKNTPKRNNGIKCLVLVQASGELLYHNSIVGVHTQRAIKVKTGLR